MKEEEEEEEKEEQEEEEQEEEEKEEEERTMKTYKVERKDSQWQRRERESIIDWLIAFNSWICKKQFSIRAHAENNGQYTHGTVCT